MPDPPSELYHFSEDPNIQVFEPHIAPTSALKDPLVWAVDSEHADLYYFPRNCPRVSFVASPDTSAEDIERYLADTDARRVSAIEASWLPAMRNTNVYRYVFPGDDFQLMDQNAGYWASHQTVRPVRVEPVGDLMQALAGAGIELRVMPSLWPLYQAVIASSLGFSIIRWRNPAPRPRRSPENQENVSTYNPELACREPRQRVEGRAPGSERRLTPHA